MQHFRDNYTDKERQALPRAENFGTAEIRAMIPGASQVVRIDRPNDIYNLRAKAYRWNDIEGRLINCKMKVQLDRKNKICTLIKRVIA